MQRSIVCRIIRCRMSIAGEETQRNIAHSLFRDCFSTGPIQTMSRGWGAIRGSLRREQVIK